MWTGLEWRISAGEAKADRSRILRQDIKFAVRWQKIKIYPVFQHLIFLRKTFVNTFQGRDNKRKPFLAHISRVHNLVFLIWSITSLCLLFDKYEVDNKSKWLEKLLIFSRHWVWPGIEGRMTNFHKFAHKQRLGNALKASIFQANHS